MQRLLLLFILNISSLCLVAQGIKGSIKDNQGEPLPFASIYIKDLGTGTSANIDGNFELPLQTGIYQVTFQFMGYATVERRVRVEGQYIELDIQLAPQVIDLPTVEVSGRAEDPAYTIMRKAIAKAEYHLLQNDRYTAEVYMKGTGQITKVPWILKRTFEKEGIDTSQVFTSESVSEILFERPNTFKEKVISVRASGQDLDNANPNAYINGSFYTPQVVNAISPLHPRAFAYYRFEYQGSFRERGDEINKIKVTPRSKGDDVFEGEIYIRENYWNIHSLDLTTSLYGFKIHIKQIYAPVVDQVWMPVNQQFEFWGSVFGLSGKYTYLASVSNYQIIPNPDLNASVILVDEKIEEVPKESVEMKSSDLETGMNEVFDQEKEISRKEFRKLMREYEKEELKEQEKVEQDVLSDYWYTIDSTAAKKDSLYWAKIRPVPLTDREVKSYQLEDSTYVVEKAQAEADSARLRNGSPLKLKDLLFGSYYKLGERLRFDFDGFLPHTNFNTVEGFHVDFTGTFLWRNDTTTRLQIRPYIRYGFASNQVYAQVESQFGIGKGEQRNTFRINGGSYVSQFNPGIVDPLINSYVAFTRKRSWIRLYQKDYVQLSWARRFRYKHTVSISAEWQKRTELFNNTDFTIIGDKEVEYKLNAPENEEILTTPFNQEKALKWVVNYRVKPWLKFRRYNGRLIPLRNSSPELRLTYKKGINGILGSTVDYDQVELGLKSTIDLGVRAKVDLDVEAGKFINSEAMDFMDFKHFSGNRMLFSPKDVSGGYRLLDYYRHSTQQEYVSLLSHIRFRKLLFTHIAALRLTGVKENVFVNYLHTPTAENYMEVGYGIDNLFRLFRLELVQSFQGWESSIFAVRIGVASIFDN
jgi:hypothetical protein